MTEDNPLHGLLEAIDRLTRPINDTLWQEKFREVRRLNPEYPDEHTEKWLVTRVPDGKELVTVKRDPLIVQLRKAIASSTSVPANPVSGGGAMMGGLNIAAFALYETVDGRIRAAWGDLRQPQSKALTEQILRKWYSHVRNLFESGQVPDSFVYEWQRITRGWVRQIEAMFNPEVVKELVGPCPECEATRAANREGEEQSALYLHYSTENTAEAMCRVCGWSVSGDRGLLELGYHLGATVDEEALKDMGVIA
jgi:hypothetical protein